MRKVDWWRHYLHSLIRLNDGPWRWRVGLQAGLANGIPLTVFTAMGHQSDGLIAMLGAFTALYFGRLSLADRLRVLPLIASGFTIAAVIGAYTSANAWLTIVGLVFVALVAAGLSFSFSVGPPGPMMFVLVAGVAGRLTAPPDLGGAGVNQLRVGMLIAIGAFSAFLIVVAPLVIPAVRRREGPPAPPGVRLSFAPFDDVSKIIMSRVVLAVTLSSLISIPLGMSHAYWVIMTAGVLLQTGHTLDVPTIRAIQRVVGTLLGVVIFSLLSRLHPSGFDIVVIVALGQCLTEVVIVRNYGLGLLFITPLALTIATANGTAHPLAVSEDRILDTLLGAAIALTVLYGTEWLRSRLWQRVEA